MIDYDILKECGTTNERLKEFFTAKEPSVKQSAKMDPKQLKAIRKDVEQRKKFEVMVSNWLSEHIVFSLQNHYLISAVDIAWDSAPIQKNMLPLMMYAQGRISIETVSKALKEVPNGDQYVRRNSEGAAVGIDLPKFTDVNINLIRSVINRRLAAQSNKYNSLWPWFKYEPRTTGNVGKLRGDTLSMRVDVMADQYDYRHFQTQVTRDMFLYGHCVAFPRASWEREVQWEKVDLADEFTPAKAKDGKIPKKARVVKEGIAWVNPHPSRVFYDNKYPLSTLNCDIGCEYVGFWDVCRYGDIADNPAYFNRNTIGFSAATAAWFTNYSIYFNQYFDRITPPSLPQDASSRNDAKNNIGLYTGDLSESSAFFTNVYVKVIPQNWGCGDYPYPVWVHLKVAGDATVVYADIMPSSPASVFSYNENDGRLVNISLAHELMPYQDQLSNLFSQLLQTCMADLFSVAVLNTDIFPETDEGRKIKGDFEGLMRSPASFASMHVLCASFEKLRDLGIQVTADNIFKVVRSAPNTAIDKIFQSITQVISTAERLTVLSSQEQGQPAPREISATETNLIGGSTESVYSFISSAVDEGRASQKRIIYESLIAKGSDAVYLPTINRYPDKIVEKAGFKVVQDEDDEEGGQLQYRNITGSKHALVHDYIFTTRDGDVRASNTQSANILVQLLTGIGSMKPEIGSAIISAMGKEKLFDIYNEAFRLSGAAVDLKLELKPGDSNELLIENDQQVMALIQRLGQAVQKNTQDIQGVEQVIGQITGQPPNVPPQAQQPQAPPQQQMAMAGPPQQ